MKLTESKLRRIIREEKQKLDEEQSFNQLMKKLTSVVDDAYDSARKNENGKPAVKYALALIEKAVDLLLESEVTPNVPESRVKEIHRELSNARIELDRLVDEVK